MSSEVVLGLLGCIVRTVVRVAPPGARSRSTADQLRSRGRLCLHLLSAVTPKPCCCCCRGSMLSRIDDALKKRAAEGDGDAPKKLAAAHDGAALDAEIVRYWTHEVFRCKTRWCGPRNAETALGAYTPSLACILVSPEILVSPDLLPHMLEHLSMRQLHRVSAVCRAFRAAVPTVLLLRRALNPNPTRGAHVYPNPNPAKPNPKPDHVRAPIPAVAVLVGFRCPTHVVALPDGGVAVAVRSPVSSADRGRILSSLPTRVATRFSCTKRCRSSLQLRRCRGALQALSVSCLALCVSRSGAGCASAARTSYRHVPLRTDDGLCNMR